MSFPGYLKIMCCFPALRRSMLEWDKTTYTKTSPTSFSAPKEQTQFFGDFLCFRRILKAFDARAKEQENFSVIAPFMTCPSTLSETVHFLANSSFLLTYVHVVQCAVHVP